MITKILFVLAALIIAIITIKRDWKTHKERCSESNPNRVVEMSTDTFEKIWMCIWRPIIAFIIGIVIGGFFAITVGFFFPHKQVVIITNGIYPMNDSCRSGERGYVGISIYKKTPYYFYSLSNSEYGNLLNKMQMTDVQLVEDDSSIPRIEYLRAEFTEEYYNLFGMCVNNSHDARIIIPKNSTRTLLHFDLKYVPEPDLIMWQ